MQNKILLGLEYGNQDTESVRRNGVLSNANLNLANIIYPTVTFTTLARDSSSNVQVFSAYAQDQISLGAHLDLVVGLRYDRFEITGTDRLVTPARPFARTDEEVSPRIGLIVKPQENVSLYASFSRSFLPRSGEQFLTLSATNQNLEPERYTNYEVGAKWDITPAFGLTLALCQLDRTNATTPDPANPTVNINIGETIAFAHRGDQCPQRHGANPAIQPMPERIVHAIGPGVGARRKLREGTRIPGPEEDALGIDHGRAIDGR